MNFSKSNFSVVVTILATVIALSACKTKKLAQKPVAAQPVQTPPPVAKPTPPPAQPEQAAAPAPKPDYNFSNIQFEFNSAVLKTQAYTILDKAAAQMKIDPTVKFQLKGFASIEGTPEHNLILSQDRANSVKEYLINSGVSATELDAKGYGTSNPIGDNDTEAGREINRRVEFSKE